MKDLTTTQQPSSPPDSKLPYETPKVTQLGDWQDITMQLGGASGIGPGGGFVSYISPK